MSGDWHIVANADEIPSPALLIYADRVQQNIDLMVSMIGDPARLRPHVKTHKMAEIVRLQLDAGITKFKCATIAEAEMCADAGAPDVLLAYQPVGPNARRLRTLAEKFPETQFSTVADDAGVIQTLSDVFADAKNSLPVLIDLDSGMSRSGIAPGDAAFALYELIDQLPGLKAGGLHAYDGHLHMPDAAERKEACDACMKPVRALRDRIETAGMSVPRLVASGSPTYPIHAQSSDVECSPGTTLLWDFGYSDAYADMDFQHAALVMARVVSKPGEGLLCLDLGHKAIASENPHPRVRLIGLKDAEFTTHSEEHLVVKTERANDYEVGDCVYGIPRHICPTVNLYGAASIVRDGRADGHWKVIARERSLSV